MDALYFANSMALFGEVTAFGGGTVSKPPTLRIASDLSGGVRISWPDNGGTMILRTTRNLSPPIDWEIVSGAPTLVDGEFVILVNPIDTSRFYQLSSLN